jgi:hypothetical protein
MTEYKYKTELITDTSMLNEKEKDLIVFACNQEWGTPKFKLRHFVGDAQITPYAKLKQFVVELRNREEMIEQMSVDVAKNEILIDIEIDKKNEAKTDNQKKYHDIEIDRLINDNNKFKRRLNTAYEERQKIISIINEMYENREAFLEDGTEIISIFGTEKEEELESRYWTLRLAKQAALDILSYGRIGTGNMDAISMLGANQQADTLELAINYSVEIDSAMEKMTSRAVESSKKKQRSTELNSLSKEISPNNNLESTAEIIEIEY